MPPLPSLLDHHDQLQRAYLLDNPFAPMFVLPAGIVTGRPAATPEAARTAALTWCEQHRETAVEAWIVQNWPIAAVVAGFRREIDGSITTL